MGTNTFPEMVKIVPESEHGIAQVTHFEIDEAKSSFSALRGGGDWIPEGKYARLRVNGSLVMTDTRMEHITNFGVLHNATGNVLIAGLGLGMILHPILKKPEVKTVTVVEKYPDVIVLIQPTLKSKKLTITQGDIYKWRPIKGTTFDSIYFDIWSEQSTDCLKDMTRLHRAFRPYLVAGGWMESWRREYLRSKRRQEQRRGW